MFFVQENSDCHNGHYQSGVLGILKLIKPAQLFEKSAESKESHQRERKCV